MYATVDSSGAENYLKGIRSRLQAELESGVRTLMASLKGHIQNDKLSGQVLKRQTGELSDSLADSVVSSGDLVTGSVRTDVRHGVAWEYGFTRVWSQRGSVTYPARSFARSALTDFNVGGDIKRTVEEAVTRATA